MQKQAPFPGVASPLAALRRRMVVLRAGVLAFGVIALAGYWAGIALDLRRSEETARVRVESLVRSRAGIVGEFVEASLARFDFALVSAREALARPVPALADHGRFVLSVMPPGMVHQLFFVGADGYLSYSSLQPVSHTFVGDRDYFTALAHASGDPLVISDPVVGRISNQWSIQLARTVNGADGRFAGIVAVSISPEKWAEHLGDAEQGPRDVLAVLNRDGSYLLRSTDISLYLGRKVNPDRPFLRETAQQTGIYTEAGSHDGVLRTYAWRRLPSGLIVVAGGAVDDLLAPLHAIRERSFVNGLWGSASLVVSLIGLLLVLQRFGRETEQTAEREASVRTMFATMAEGLAIVLPDGNISFYNEAFAYLLQLSPAQLLERSAHMSDWPLTDADGKPLALEQLPSVKSARTGTSYDAVVLGTTMGGRGQRWLSVSTRPLYHPAATHPYAAVLTLRDITQERRANAAARISQWVFDSASEGIIVTDALSTILAVNPAFTAITGYAATEAIGRKPALLSAGQHEAGYYQQIYRTLADSGRWEGEFIYRRKDGETYISHIRISCQRDSHGHVQHYVALFADVTERKRKDQEIWHQANFDALTGLPNRVLLLDRLAHLLFHARRHGGQVAVLFIDLDRFKPVNDVLGHAAGDELLRQVAHRVQILFREEDTVARLGGDEFVVLLPDQNGLNTAERAAQRIVEALSQPFRLGEQFVEIACSIGISFFPRDGDAPEALLHAADVAMYRAKGAGRATWSH